MNTIDLTSAESALNYLRSLPADQAISLPGHYTESTAEGDAVRTITEESALNYRAFGVVTWETDGLSTTEGDAVRAITEESAHTWAGNRRQWEWTAAALVATLEAEIADREAAANE